MYVRNLALLYQKRQDVRVYIELLLTIAVVTIFTLFAIRPTIITITELHGEIATKKNTVGILDRKIDALVQAQQTYDSNLALIRLVPEAIPERPDPARYLRQIEGVAAQNGISITSSSVGEVDLLGASIQEPVSTEGEEVPQEIFPQIPSLEISFFGAGSYEQVVAFLREIENLRRPMYMDTANISIATPDQPGEIVISINSRVPYLQTSGTVSESQ